MGDSTSSDARCEETQPGDCANWSVGTSQPVPAAVLPHAQPSPGLSPACENWSVGMSQPIPAAVPPLNTSYSPSSPRTVQTMLDAVSPTLAFGGRRAHRSPMRCRRGWQNVSMGCDTPRGDEYADISSRTIMDEVLDALGLGEPRSIEGQVVPMQSPRTVHSENEVLRSECANLKAEVARLKFQLTQTKSRRSRSKSNDAMRSISPGQKRSLGLGYLSDVSK